MTVDQVSAVRYYFLKYQLSYSCASVLCSHPPFMVPIDQSALA